MALIKNSLFIQLFVMLANTLPVGAKLVLQITSGAADRTHHSPATSCTRPPPQRPRDLCAWRPPSSAAGVDSHVDLRHANYNDHWELQLVFACAVAHYISRCVSACCLSVCLSVAVCLSHAVCLLHACRFVFLSMSVCRMSVAVCLSHV